jgi:hypothetical protein
MQQRRPEKKKKKLFNIKPRLYGIEETTHSITQRGEYISIFQRFYFSCYNSSRLFYSAPIFERSRARFWLRSFYVAPA